MVQIDQERSQTLNHGWARMEDFFIFFFLILLYCFSFSSIFFMFFLNLDLWVCGSSTQEGPSCTGGVDAVNITKTSNQKEKKTGQIGFHLRLLL